VTYNFEGSVEEVAEDGTYVVVVTTSTLWVFC
jgi:hypothetical protein